MPANTTKTPLLFSVTLADVIAAGSVEKAIVAECERLEVPYLPADLLPSQYSDFFREEFRNGAKRDELYVAPDTGRAGYFEEQVGGRDMVWTADPVVRYECPSFEEASKADPVAVREFIDVAIAEKSPHTDHAAWDALVHRLATSLDTCDRYWHYLTFPQAGDLVERLARAAINLRNAVQVAIHELETLKAGAA